MALEIRGRVIKVMDMQSGVSRNGAWSKREFVIETEEQYPKKVCLSVWGDRADNFDMQFPVGSAVVVAITLESREYNSKWYTDARAWKVELQSAHSAQSANAPIASPPLPDSEGVSSGAFADDGLENSMPF
jgi:hypothetical protein